MQSLAHESAEINIFSSLFNKKWSSNFEIMLHKIVSLSKPHKQVVSFQGVRSDRAKEERQGRFQISMLLYKTWEVIYQGRSHLASDI